jgi:hypothetical protein
MYAVCGRWKWSHLGVWCYLEEPGMQVALSPLSLLDKPLFWSSSQTDHRHTADLASRGHVSVTSIVTSLLKVVWQIIVENYVQCCQICFFYFAVENKTAAIHTICFQFFFFLQRFLSIDLFSKFCLSSHSIQFVIKLFSHCKFHTICFQN